VPVTYSFGDKEVLHGRCPVVRGRCDRGADPEGPPAEKEIEPLQGEWTAVEVWFGGSAVKEQEVRERQIRYVLRGQTLALSDRGKEMESGTFTLEGEAAPFRMTVDISVSLGRPYTGSAPDHYLIERTGDKMRIAWLNLDDLAGKEVPKAIDPKSATQNVYVLTRTAK
jgi:uncharacterized protein (TIGR03067 family)